MSVLREDARAAIFSTFLSQYATSALALFGSPSLRNEGTTGGERARGRAVLRAGKQFASAPNSPPPHRLARSRFATPSFPRTGTNDSRKERRGRGRITYTIFALCVANSRKFPTRSPGYYATSIDCSMLKWMISTRFVYVLRKVGEFATDFRMSWEAEEGLRIAKGAAGARMTYQLVSRDSLSAESVPSRRTSK